MLSVKELMTDEVFFVTESDTLLSARRLMELKRIRHVPVVSQDGHFVGLLTHRDLLAHTISLLAEIDDSTQREIDSGIPVREIMRTNVKTITPEIGVREAAEILLKNKYGCLPVESEGKLVGILTEADFLKFTISLVDELAKVGS